MTTRLPQTSTAAQTFGGTAMRVGDFSRPSSMHMPTDAMVAIDRNHAAVRQELGHYLKRNQSWISRILPTEKDRLLQDYELQQARSECSYTLRLLALGYEAKYQACHEESEAWLQTMKVETRTKVAGFLAEQESKLRAQINHHKRQLQESVRETYAEIERSADIPVFQERLRRSLFNEIDETITWLDSLLAGFRQIHMERLSVQAPT